MEGHGRGSKGRIQGVRVEGLNDARGGVGDGLSERAREYRAGCAIGDCINAASCMIALHPFHLSQRDVSSYEMDIVVSLDYNDRIGKHERRY